MEENGTYNLEITYASLVNGGTFELTIAGQTFEHTVQIVDWNEKARLSPLAVNYKTFTFGTVELKPGRFQLTVKPIEINDESTQDVWFQTKFTYNFSIIYGITPSYSEEILENNILIEIQYPPYPPANPPPPKLIFNSIIFGVIGVVFIYYVNSIRKMRDKVKRIRS